MGVVDIKHVFRFLYKLALKYLRVHNAGNWVNDFGTGEQDEWPLIDEFVAKWALNEGHKLNLVQTKKVLENIEMIENARVLLVDGMLKNAF